MKLTALHPKITLEKLIAPDGYGVYASGGPRYQYAIFGRDSLEVGEDVLYTNPSLVRDILLTMARLQGRRSDKLTEEEPGKIHHEYRMTNIGGTTIPDISRSTVERLGQLWGGTKEEFCYYGSVDATPLFVRLVGRYVAVYGHDILNERIVDRYGDERSLYDQALAATEWICRRVEASSWQLLEFQRINPKGLAYQGWKDSDTGYLHIDGTPAMAETGIASIEIQGYAYDALMAASQFITANDTVRQCTALARKVQSQTLKLLWMKDNDHPFFAMGLDRDTAGATRQIKTLTSNAAAVLDSRILLDLSEDVRREYTQPIVATIMSADFLTDVGIRTRALRHAKLLDIADYHGSLVSWPKETYDIAKGLRRHGYEREAVILENALLETTSRSDEYYEFYYVNAEGDVVYSYADFDKQMYVPHLPTPPEPCQAWTVSAILAIMSNTQES